MAELMMQLDGNVLGEIPYHPLGDHLAIALVYDLPEAMQTIGQERLDKWGVTLYEAMEVARENLGNCHLRSLSSAQRKATASSFRRQTTTTTPAACSSWIRSGISG